MFQRSFASAEYALKKKRTRREKRTLCGRKILLWRDTSGRLIAMDDLCCHRGAPLSCGRHEGDSVRCMYHGFLYDGAGRCIDIPGHDRIPPKAKLRSYAVVEQHRWIWVWMGDAAAADGSRIPDTHWVADTEWACTSPGYIHYDANYLLVNDNLLDFSHFSYVHPTTVGASEEYARLRSKVDRIDNGVRITRWFMDRPPAPFVAGVLERRGVTGNVDRWNNYDFLLPGILIMHTGFAPAGSGAERGNMRDAIEFRACQAVTPETEDSCHYFFTQPRNFDQDRPEVTEHMERTLLKAFDEDREIITAQAENLRLQAEFTPVPVRARPGAGAIPGR
jgi:vanillate O-demethylase monooxygenase subunit